MNMNTPTNAVNMAAREGCFFCALNKIRTQKFMIVVTRL